MKKSVIHIYCFAGGGVRGRLSYDFELDQTIIKDLIDQIHNEL